jgi:hypothetical protein
MTYPEKTICPVASMNDQDFSNLMDTYLDAVFFPNVREKKEIFLQEGWHYEFNEEDQLVYGGVVFNEMKGAMSASNRRFFQAMEAALYPNSPYATNSGGDPLAIPELTWEKLKEAHATYYHPSNSIVYLYGNLAIEERLKHVAEYLDEFEKLDVSDKLADLNGQEVVSESIVEFPISEKEDASGQAYLGYGVKLKGELPEEISVAAMVLKELLIDSDSAPLRQALIQAGIGKHVFGNFDEGSPTPAFTIGVGQSDAEKKDEFEKIIVSTLTRLVENGIDKKIIKAALATIEFQLREADFGGAPEGLIYGLQVIEAYAADKKWTEAVKYEAALEKLKAEIENDYFESFIKNYLLENEQRTIVVAKPSTTIGKVEYEKEQSALQQANTNITDEVKEKLKKEEMQLQEFQNMEDSPEAKASLPKLDISDISKKPMELPTEVSKVDDVTLLFHPQATNKLAYFTMYFDAGNVSIEKLPYYKLLTNFLGKLGTSKYTAEELSQEIAIEVGEIHFSNQLYSKSPNDAVHKIKVDVRTTEERIEKAIELVTHIMQETDFDNKEKIKELIGKAVAGSRIFLENSGHIAGMNRVLSHHTLAGAKKETLSGLSFHHFLQEIEATFDEVYEQMIYQVAEVSQSIYRKDNVTVSFTGEEKAVEAFRSAFHMFQLENGTYEESALSVSPTVKKEAFTNSSQVVYVSQGANIQSIGKKVTGSLLVTQNMLNLDFLWNRIRAIGGAYGAGIRLSLNGDLTFFSYRDPNIKSTLDTYNQTAEFLASIELDRDAIERLIIGTIGTLGRPLTPRMVGEQADTHYFAGITEEKRQEIREQVLQTTLEDIKETADIFKALLEKQSVVVIGNERTIEEESERFDVVEGLFK